VVRSVAPLLFGIAVGLVTRWPVAVVLGAATVSAIPYLVRQTSSSHQTDHIEAVAVWTELLRDTLSASAGLAQAIIATAPVAPPAIRTPVTGLANRIVSGVPMSDALLLFGADVDDSSADLVVCALLLAATSRAQRLAELLGTLAASIRDEVAMRLRVEASRASARSGVRSVAACSLVFVALLTLIARSYLAPYDTALGQTVLLVVGACYAAGIYLMIRLVRAPSPVRILQPGRR
jgi:tight adherence protein B